MKDALKKFLTALLGWGIIALLILAIISVLAIFGGAIMRFFGFTYDSIGSIILFFVCITLAGFPLEVVASALPKALLSLGRISHRACKVLSFVLDACGTAITMLFVDTLMDSVSASGSAIAVCSLLLALPWGESKTPDD